MLLKSVVAASTLLAAAAAVVPTAGTARAAIPAKEAEMFSLNQLCNAGDRKACVRFGILLGRMQERQAEWRHVHPDWYWWER